MIFFLRKTKILSLLKVVLIVAVVFWALPQISHAAAAVPPVTDINKIQNGQNGWTTSPTDAGTEAGIESIGGTGVTSYTNTNGTKAICYTNVSAGDALRECNVTYPDGTTTDLQQDNANLAPAQVAQTNQVTNVNTTGTVTSQTSASSPGAGVPTGVAECIGSGLLNCVLSGIAYFLFTLAATILGLVGLLFNWVVTVTVFEFGTYFANSAGMLAAWGILRDIGNIILLFGFIFMGILMILDLESFNIRKALPRLLIFAVLLNFSLFASEAVVDVANTLTAAFYQAAGTANCASNNNNGLSNGACDTVGITGAILASSGMSTIWNQAQNNTLPAQGTDSALVMFLEAIFCIIAAVVLLAGAIMLAIRAITLAFLLVVSPLGFAGMAIPPLQKQAMSWWNKLISEAFFAPIFLLLIFVGLKLTSILQPQAGTTFNAALVSPGASSFGTIFLFLLVMGFMVAALIVAKSFGAAGANIAISTSTRAMGAATFGTTGFVARRTIGAGAGKGAQLVRSSRIGNTEFGRILAGGLDKGAHSSFDARSTGPIKGLGKNKFLAVDFGSVNKTAKGGIHGIEEKAKADRVKYSESLQMTDAESAAAPGLKRAKAELLREQTTVLARLAKTVAETTGPENIAARKAEAAAKEEYAEKMAAADKNIIDNDPKLRYARNLENSWLPSAAFLPVLGLGTHANHDAAKVIKREANKNATTKALEKLSKTIESQTEEIHDDHAEDQAQAQTAPTNNASASAAPTHGPAHN